ncbi:MAG: SAM-dependent DNA methyltransferase, partial [Bacteroidetes bacterium]|nr:SAM-dependent DNA methyltransferase [Bacteroidota bacterium]
FFAKGKPTKDVWYYEHRMPEDYKAYSKTRPIQLKEFEPIKKWWNKRKESEVAWKVNIKTIKERGYDLDIKNPTKKEEAVELSSSELMEQLAKSFDYSHKLLYQLKQAVK